MRRHRYSCYGAAMIGYVGCSKASAGSHDELRGIFDLSRAVPLALGWDMLGRTRLVLLICLSRSATAVPVLATVGQLVSTGIKGCLSEIDCTLALRLWKCASLTMKDAMDLYDSLSAEENFAIPIWSLSISSTCRT